MNYRPNARDVRGHTCVPYEPRDWCRSIERLLLGLVLASLLDAGRAPEPAGRPGQEFVEVERMFQSLERENPRGTARKPSARGRRGCHAAAPTAY